MQPHATVLCLWRETPNTQVLQVFGGDKGKTRRVHNLQSDVAALEAALEAAQAEYDKVMDRNLKVRETAGRSKPLRCREDTPVAVSRLDTAPLLLSVCTTLFQAA